MAESKLKYQQSQSGTRNAKSVFGIGAGITDADAEITGSRLPTSRQVLRCYMIYQDQGLRLRQTQLDTAKFVLQKIVPFHENRTIPMITNKKSL